MKVSFILIIAAGAAFTQSAAAQAAANAEMPKADQQITIEGVWGGGGGQALSSIEHGDDVLTGHRQIMIGNGAQRGIKSLVIDPPDGVIPFQPWALALRDKRLAVTDNPPSLAMLDPAVRCSPPGIPRMMYRGAPQITKFADSVLMEFEWGHFHRTIYTDGRPPIPASLKLWNGDQRGHWEGNTLVIQTTSLNGYPWLDLVGDFYSDQATVEERFVPVDADNMYDEITITDPAVFTRPWKIRLNYRRDRAPNPEIYEFACVEGNHAMKTIFGTTAKK